MSFWYFHVYTQHTLIIFTSLVRDIIPLLSPPPAKDQPQQGEMGSEKRTLEEKARIQAGCLDSAEVAFQIVCSLFFLPFLSLCVCPSVYVCVYMQVCYSFKASISSVLLLNRLFSCAVLFRVEHIVFNSFCQIFFNLTNISLIHHFSCLSITSHFKTWMFPGINWHSLHCLGLIVYTKSRSVLHAEVLKVCSLYIF